jgi:hypothetical protein
MQIVVLVIICGISPAVALALKSALSLFTLSGKALIFGRLYGSLVIDDFHHRGHATVCLLNSLHLSKVGLHCLLG